MSTVITHELTALRYVGGSSDKTYIAALVEDSSGLFSVECDYGRTGAVNKHTTKASGVTCYKARDAFNKVVTEKINKGYAVVSAINEEIVRPFSKSSTAIQMVTSHPAQLLNSIEEGDVSVLIESGLWTIEEKMDGNRVQVGVIIHSSGIASIVGYNRKGQGIPLPINIVRKFECMQCACIKSEMAHAYLFDGELIGDVYYVFDCLVAGGEDISQIAYVKRRMRMKAELKQILSDQASIFIVPLLPESMETIAKLKETNSEGAVLKKKDSKYSAGRPNSGGPCLKLKFTDSVTCIVTGINQQRSVQIGLWSEAQSWADEPRMIDVGNVTVPPNKEVSKIGDLIEIRYLYMFPGGSLYQPVFLSTRNDIDNINCTIGQIKRFKPLPNLPVDPE